MTDEQMQVELPDLPTIPDRHAIPYEAIRYVAGYAKRYVQEYAKAYATAAILADRERRAAKDAGAGDVMPRLTRNHDGDLLLAVGDTTTLVAKVGTPLWEAIVSAATQAAPATKDAGAVAVAPSAGEEAPQSWEACAECGRTSTKNGMWATYCLDCIEHKIAPAFGLTAPTEAQIDDFLEDYEMVGEDETGREVIYTPNDQERFLIKDAIMGLLADMPTPPAPAAPVSDGYVYIRLKRPEGYEDVHPDLVLQDAHIHEDFCPELLGDPAATQQAEPAEASQRVLDAIRRAGFTLVKTQHGVHRVKLGECVAQSDPSSTTQQAEPSPLEQAAEQERQRIQREGHESTLSGIARNWSAATIQRLARVKTPAPKVQQETAPHDEWDMEEALKEVGDSVKYKMPVDNGCLRVVFEYAARAYCAALANQEATPSAAEPVMLNGLTEAQTSATASVAGVAASPELIAAARAVVARWHSPKWKDEAPTAEFIQRLERALPPNVVSQKPVEVDDNPWLPHNGGPCGKRVSRSVQRDSRNNCAAMAR